ncbi:MAG: hypothetical protein L6437_08730, partial [Kiritimatiellae bacterium]|nr:hypothetical protein [Kiritimatiellia bacterium]
MSFRATVALLGNVTETSGIPSLETMTWVRYPQVLSLGVVIYLLGVHGALCSMDITEPDTGWKWSSVAHIHPGSVFKLSEARPDGNEKKAGIVSIACEVTAQVAKKNDPAGYVEIIGKINEPLDLTQYQALSFAYRFSKILPDKSIRSMWIYLGGGTKERIEVIADGQWHEVVIPLYEFITNPRDTILEKATGIAFCYYVRPTEENQEVKFTFWLDDVKLEEKSQGKQKPAILCLTPSTKETYGRRAVEFISEPVEKELKNRGFERGWHVGWDDLCMNYLKAFNAVIFYDYPFLTPGEAIPPEVRKQIELFQKYVKEGGSLFFASSPYTQAKIIVMNELMKPMNGKVYAELVKDESNVYKLSYPCPFITFSWTDAITRSPLTEGVTGLYYGTTFLEPGSPTTLPAEVGNEWQILARGLPSTSSFKVDPSANSVSGKGTFAESPVLVAVREYGKGRIVLWPMSLTFTMMDGYSWMLENGIVMDGKANGRISNGGRLLYNLLQWLVEPSMPEKNFGGYKQPEETSLSKKKAKHKAIKWSKPRGEVINPIYQHAYLGLAGAMSHLSSGKSSPEEMIKAAKTAGYRFVVFTEDVETLSRDSWDKLIAVCKQNSDTNFYAFPGFYYKTQWGAEYITFGGHADLCYPLPEWV